MIPQLQTRLRELREEFAEGEQKLNDLNAQAAQLRDTLLRISGAIQVLEEELTKIENSQLETEFSTKSETDFR